MKLKLQRDTNTDFVTRTVTNTYISLKTLVMIGERQTCLIWDNGFYELLQWCEFLLVNQAKFLHIQQTLNSTIKLQQYERP